MTSTFQAPSKILLLRKANQQLLPLPFTPKRFVNPDELIFVGKPYNRLRQIERVTADSLRCIVFNEYQGDLEGGSIGTAEVGRHIAILGSIQLALEYNFGEKCFFLAIGATLKQSGRHPKQASVGSNINKKFHLVVKTISADKKHAFVAGQVFDEDFNEVFTAEIKYLITRSKVFERLFAEHRTPSFSGATTTGSPYGIARKQLSEVTFTGTTASGFHPLVEARECLGHFPEYPCLPVAVIGNHFIQIGIKLFANHFGNSYSSIVALESSLEAKRLVFAGESIQFVARIHTSLPEGILSVTADATVDGEVVASATMLFQGQR